MTINYTTKLENKRIISITGDETDNFLNNIITNDVKKINNNSAIYACLLTPQGKLSSHFFLTKTNNQYLIIIDDYLTKDLINKLNFYKLRSKITIEIDNQNQIIFSLDPNFKINSIIEFIDPRNKKFGKYFLISNKESVNNAFDSLDYYNKFLSENGLIDEIFSIIKDQYFSLELNMKELNAIDFSKGCFVGQENTARMNLKEKISKRIFLLKSDEILKSNEDLKYNNQVVGKVLTSNPNFGLIKMLNFDDFKNRNLNIENKKEVKIIYPIWLF